MINLLERLSLEACSTVSFVLCTLLLTGKTLDCSIQKIVCVLTRKKNIAAWAKDGQLPTALFVGKEKKREPRNQSG